MPPPDPEHYPRPPGYPGQARPTGPATRPQDPPPSGPSRSPSSLDQVWAPRRGPSIRIGRNEGVAGPNTYALACKFSTMLTTNNSALSFILWGAPTRRWLAVHSLDAFRRSRVSL